VTRLRTDATPIQREARRSAIKSAVLNAIGLVKPMRLSGDEKDI
jgi:hypothetical protein